MTTYVSLMKKFIKEISFAPASIFSEDNLKNKFKDSVDDGYDVTKVAIVKYGAIDRGLVPVKAIITVTWEERL